MGNIFSFLNHFLKELLELAPSIVYNIFFLRQKFIELVLPQNIIP